MIANSQRGKSRFGKQPNVVVIIPARYGSTRLPAKPLIDLCGKPMIQHVYERARQATFVGRVIVATDHEEIVDAVTGFAGEAVLTSSDLRSGSDRIAVAAKNLPDSTIVVNVQGDEPLIVPQMIDEAIQLLVRSEKVRVGTLVREIASADELLNPNVVKVALDANGDAIYFSRSPIPYSCDGAGMDQWHLRHTYYKHIGLYVFRKAFLLEFASWEESPLERIERLEQLRILEHGYRIRATITEHDSVQVDTPDDVERVRQLLKAQTETPIE